MQIGKADADIDKAKTFRGTIENSEFLDIINGAAPGDSE